jgi:hypothetical protein
MSDDMRKVSDLREDLHLSYQDLLHWSGYSGDTAPEHGEHGGGWGNFGRLYHAGELDEPDPDRPLYVMIPNASWGDYSGSMVDRANYVAILEDYKDDVITVGRGTHDGEGLALRWDAEIPTDLYDGIVGISPYGDYPLWNEEVALRLEMEEAWEAWDGYLGSDTVREIEERLSERDPCDVPSDEWGESDYTRRLTEWADSEKLRERYYELTSDAPFYPYAESATSMVFPDHDEIVAQLAEEIVAEVRAEWDEYARSLNHTQPNALEI